MARAGEREILGEGSDPAVLPFDDECEHGIAYEDVCDSCDTDTVLPASHCGHAACARWWVDTGDCSCISDDGPRSGMGAVVWMVGAVVALLGLLAGYLAIAWGCL